MIVISPTDGLQPFEADLRSAIKPPRADPPGAPASLSSVGVSVLALLIVAATWVSIAHTRVQGGVASVWIANGVIVGMAVLAPQREWLKLFIVGATATLLTRVLYGDAMGLALLLTAVNVFECALIAGTIRHFVPDVREPTALPRLARVAVAITVIACLLTASIVAEWFSSQSGQAFGRTWSTWFTAHLLGMVITATMTVTAMRLKLRVFGRPGRRLDLALCLGLLAVTCVAVRFAEGLPVLFLVFLPLMLVTYRHGFAGVVTGIAVLVIAGGVEAGLELGPFELMQGRSFYTRSLLLQVFVGAACLLTFPTAVALAERRRLAARLAAISDNMPAMIASFDAEERVTYINAAVSDALALKPSEILGRTLREVRGEVVYAEMAGHVAGALAGEPQAFEGQASILGRRRDHSTRLVPDRGADGGVRGFYSLTFDITALKTAERELQRLARFDALTGLPNRRHFDENLEQACARAQRNGRPLMLLALDLDNFKQINDEHGHSVGDAVLRSFAARIRDCVYEVDLPARLGGDEFVVLVEYSPDPQVGVALAERILKAMHEPVVVGGITLSVSTSVGIGVVHPVRVCEELLEVADAALYEAKAGGRNGWRLRGGSGLKLPSGRA